MKSVMESFPNWESTAYEVASVSANSLSVMSDEIYFAVPMGHQIVATISDRCEDAELGIIGIEELLCIP